MASWFGMTVLGLIVTGVIPNDKLEPGDPRRLVNGIDYNGRICGVDTEVEAKSKIYYMPSTSGVCIESCPMVTNYTQFHCLDEVQADIVQNDTGAVDLTAAWAYVASGECLYHIPTTDILGTCVFDTVLDLVNETASVVMSEAMSEALNGTGANATLVSVEVPSSNWFEDLFADIMTAKAYISGFGLGVPILVGFLYLVFLRLPGVLCLLIWGLIGTVWALFLGGGLLLYTNAKSWAAEPEPRTHSTGQIYAAEVLSYVLYGVCALWTLLMLWFRKRVWLAIAVTEEAARAINAMKAIIFCPIFQALGLFIFLVPWSVYAVYLASSGEITTGTVTTSAGEITVKSFQYTTNIRYAALYLLFSYFWTSEFITALGQIVVAMAVAMWYFTRDKSEIGSLTVVQASCTSVIYHSGTAAFGSLIIAVIKTVRAVVAYFQKKAKDSGNKIVQAVLCCVQCCLWCLEKCMKFLNKNAYIQTAIFGYSFCKAAKKAFFLIARNIVRVGAVSLVSEIVIILGMVVVPLVSTFAFYTVADSQLGSEVHGMVGITVLVAIVSFFIGKMFTEVFGMAISTILQCFIADEEMFEEQDRFGEGHLAATVAHANAEKGEGHQASKVAPTEDGDSSGRGDKKFP